MMTSGSREKESFWVLSSLMTRKTDSHPQMAGFSGFFAAGFPLLEKYMMVFDCLFKEHLPDLHAHFKQEGVPELLWIHKWF